jgi:DNA-binding response OmpR family regulator
MHILLVEDNPGDACLLQVMLAETGTLPLQVTGVDRLATGLVQVAQSRVDVILLDLSLPDSQGMGTLTRMHTAARGVPIVC